MVEGRERQSRRFNLAWQMPVLALSVVLAIMFAVRKDDAAFAVSEKDTTPIEEIDINPNNRNLASSFFETFENSSPDPSEWYVSNFTIENDFFQNSWSTETVSFPEEGGYTLEIKRAQTGDKPFIGAELQRIGWFQYGRVEAIMDSAPGSGAATGLFTHTNDYFNDPHDEIDIEWIGNRANIVQFNVYRDGKPQGPWKISLPYNASEELHLYAFEWEPNEIRWYVDGEKLFSITSKDINIPHTPQRIITHLWTGSAYQWHGQPRFADGATARVRCISYQTLDELDSSARCANEVDRIIHGIQPEPALETVSADSDTDDVTDDMAESEVLTLD